MAFGWRSVVGVALIAATLGTGAAASELLEKRLGAVLGQEKRALAMVPAARLDAITTPPAAQARGIATAPAGMDYSRSFLASQPRANGNSEWQCLTEALYFEARGETVRGMFAVAEVIANRRDSGRFPNSICGVVNQGTGRKFACQFTYTCDGRPEVVNEPAAWATVGKIARLVLDGAPRALTNGATYYHTNAVNPRWARSFSRTAVIGDHYFYTDRRRTASN